MNGPLGIVFAADIWRGRVISDSVASKHYIRPVVLTPRNIRTAGRGFDIQTRKVWWDIAVPDEVREKHIGRYTVHEYLKTLTRAEPVYVYADIEVHA